MNSLKYNLWVLSFLPAICTSELNTSFNFPTISSLLTASEGDICISTATNSRGVCALPEDCESFREFRGKLNICSFIHRSPVVCCPKKKENDRIVARPSRISALKCQEYSTTRNSGSSGHHFMKRQVRARPSVVKGTLTEVSEFPHMAAIGWQTIDDTISYKCGGSLISDSFVLTAAHCSRVNSQPPTIVRLSERNLETDNPEVLYNIREIINHPKYTTKSYYNDIALIRLDRSVVINNQARPACLWQNKNINETSAIATGFGHTSFAGPSSSDLLKTTLQLVNREKCNEKYEIDSKLSKGIIAKQLCAFDEFGSDTCQGDSGGPLVVKYDTEFGSTFHLIGVTSFGRFCAGDAPGVYTKVFSYLDWIESIVWSNSQDI